MNYSKLKPYLFGTAIIVITACVLYIMGREPICECGYIKLWHGIVASSENSQHLFDWYTFTHIIHGLLLYAFLSIFAPKLSFSKKILIAIAFECAWEILENSDMVINRYRAATVSLDYYGDSIINSLGDVMAMMAGFFFAAKQKLWLSIMLCLLIELVLALIIHDNLTLNIIMLLHPFDAIKLWQQMP